MQLPTTPPPRYRIERSLGQGGLGEVFLAFDTRLRRNVALKRLSEETGGGGTPHDQAWQEAVHLAAVQHPNVVAVHDFGTDAHGPFLVMEFVDGETLEAAVAARGPLPLADFLTLARQTLEGLAAAHHAGLLHRDLKPDNVMLRCGPTGALQIKILDFGIARYSETLEIPTNHATATPAVVGAAAFLAPEQFEGGAFTQRAELYSLGCIFYHALTGQDPFRGDNTPEIINAHLRGCPPPGALRPDLPPALAAWTLRLCSRHAGDRPATVLDALAELDALFIAPIARSAL